MNIRIKSINELSNKHKKELDKYIFERGMQIYNSESEGLIRRCYKTFAVALNQQFGFGKDRITKLFDSMSDISKERDKDDVFWRHIDDIVINQIKIPFEREKYEDLDK